MPVKIAPRRASRRRQPCSCLSSPRRYYGRFLFRLSSWGVAGKRPARRPGRTLEFLLQGTVSGPSQAPLLSPGLPGLPRSSGVLTLHTCPGPAEPVRWCSGRLLVRFWTLGFLTTPLGTSEMLRRTCSGPSPIRPGSAGGSGLTVFLRQINQRLRAAALGEAGTACICALGGRDFSKLNYNLSVKYASSVGVSRLVHNYFASLSQRPP